MIYTLDWLQKEAETISGHWNGSDDRYIDGNGDSRTEDDAAAANELLEKITEVRQLIEELGI
jgi:hypothetical protein